MLQPHLFYLLLCLWTRFAYSILLHRILIFFHAAATSCYLSMKFLAYPNLFATEGFVVVVVSMNFVYYILVSTQLVIN
jgi:hypothetical protein